MATGGREPVKKHTNDKLSKLISNDFFLHMVQDKKTEMYVKFAKIMVMCQGPYSTRRSETLEQIPKIFKNCSCFISDETYCNDTKRNCQYDKTEEFYSYFKSVCAQALEQGNNLIVLDPTMSNVEQNKIYMAMAYRMQYVFFVAPPFITKSNRPDWKPRSQANSFKEVGTFIQCANMFQHLFCAFYLHDKDSGILRHEGSLYVKDCLENIPEFLKLFTSICPDNSSDSETESSEADSSSVSPKCTPASFDKYFNLNDDRQDLAFCVVKIFENMRDIHHYFNQDEVLRLYGKMSKLLIVGFIVSPYMIAARVKLTHHQKPLWDMQDNLVESHEKEVANLVCPSELVNQVKSELPDIDVKLIGSRTNPTMVNARIHLHEPTDVIHDFARGRSCHIVLGKAPGARKHNVDYDVAFALTRERNFKSEKEHVELIKLDNCVVKRLGKYCFIYLREILSIDGFLATCCKPFPYESAIKCT